MKKNTVRYYLFNFRPGPYKPRSWYLERQSEEYWRRKLKLFDDITVLRDLGLVTITKCKDHHQNKVFRCSMIPYMRDRFLSTYYLIPRNVYKPEDWLGI